MSDRPLSDTIDIDRATEVFAEHRELLFAMAYQLLGSVADTEDVLQETWLSWAAVDHDRVGNERAYLVRIAVNEALARLRRSRRSRETYVGPWLPEPLIADAAGGAADVSEDVLRAESVSMAMMVVLETLTPLERAVFVLREAFGYGHGEIASMLGRTPEAVRQLARRARSHVRARRPRAGVDASVHKAVTERFIAATVGGDLGALMELLAPDVQLWTDTGGAVRAARRVITGADKVARLLLSETIRPLVAAANLRFVTANGEPAIMLHIGDQLFAFAAAGLQGEAESPAVRGRPRCHARTAQPAGRSARRSTASPSRPPTPPRLPHTEAVRRAYLDPDAGYTFRVMTFDIVAGRLRPVALTTRLVDRLGAGFFADLGQIRVSGSPNHPDLP